MTNRTWAAEHDITEKQNRDQRDKKQTQSHGKLQASDQARGSLGADALSRRSGSGTSFGGLHDCPL